MRVMILSILLITLTTIDAVPVKGGTEDTENYIPAKSVIEEIAQEPRLNQKKESDLEPSEYHHPLLVIKYPVYGGYHGYHGHHGRHGYYRPYWHHWHGGNGWGSHYGGYHGGGIGYSWPWLY